MTKCDYYIMAQAWKDGDKLIPGKILDKQLFRQGCYYCFGEGGCPKHTTMWGLEKKLEDDR